MLKDEEVFMVFIPYLNTKDFLVFSSMNKRIHSSLRSAIGAKSCIHFFKQSQERNLEMARV